MGRGDSRLAPGDGGNVATFSFALCETFGLWLVSGDTLDSYRGVNGKSSEARSSNF